MSPTLALTLLLVAVGLAFALGLALWSRRPDEGDRQGAFALFDMVASAIAGLEVTTGVEGWPKLEGLIEGAKVEIDCNNNISKGYEGLLGLRTTIGAGARAPNAALWIGELKALEMIYGPPRAAGDEHGLFEAYTRGDWGPSDWWQDRALLDALASLHGAGLFLHEGVLTVVFAQLDPESVRTAISVVSLVSRGVEQVTLH